MLPCMLILSFGCKNANTHNTKTAQQPSPITAETGRAPQPASMWKPVTKGVAYQLTLNNGVFGFCDNTGSQQINFATGHQTASTSTCDRKNDAIRNGCDDGVDIVSSSDGPYDTVSVERYSFRLHGHARDCDRDGDLVIVSTTGEIVLMNASTTKIAFVKAVVPDTVVIGSGWAAWNSQDKKLPPHLEKTSKLLQQATTPRED